MYMYCIDWFIYLIIYADAGFYANDLKNAYSEVCGIDDIWDFVELIEIADRFRWV